MPRGGQGRKAAKAAEIASPTIAQVVDAFLAEQPARAQGPRGWALELLQDFLNGYAYESLPPAAARLFDRLFNAEGAAHREYCEIFGPERIVPELGQFLGWFLVRKVIARPKDLAIVARETGRFVKWLGERGHIPAAVAAEGAVLAAEATKAVPAAEEVATLLRPGLLDEPAPADEVIEGQFRVARAAPGKLWLESWEDGRTYGPFAVSVKVTARLKVDWELSGMGGRVGKKKWKLLEVWNVYPGMG